MEGAAPLIRQFLPNARRSFTKPAEKLDLHAWGLLWYMRSVEIENKTRENPGFIWFPWFSLGHDWFSAGRQNWTYAVKRRNYTNVQLCSPQVDEGKPNSWNWRKEKENIWKRKKYLLRRRGKTEKEKKNTRPSICCAWLIAKREIRGSTG